MALQNTLLISAMIEEAFVNTLRRVCPSVTLHVAPTNSDPLLILARAMLGQTGICPYVVRYIEPQSYSLMFWLVWFATVTGFCRLEDHGLCCRNYCALDELKYIGSQHEVRLSSPFRWLQKMRARLTSPAADIGTGYTKCASLKLCANERFFRTTAQNRHA